MARKNSDNDWIDNLLTDVFRRTGTMIDRNDPLITIALIQNHSLLELRNDIVKAIDSIKAENNVNKKILKVLFGRVSRIPSIIRTDIQNTFKKKGVTVPNENKDYNENIDDTNHVKKRTFLKILMALTVGISIGFILSKYLINYI